MRLRRAADRPDCAERRDSAAPQTKDAALLTSSVRSRRGRGLRGRGFEASAAQARLQTRALS